MAFVTRCPYCGAVWLLPDLDTAERGPVRCSACRNSFDATRELMRVADELFPDLPRPAVTIPTPFAPPKPTPQQPVPLPTAPANAAADTEALPSVAAAASKHAARTAPVQPLEQAPEPRSEQTADEAVAPAASAAAPTKPTGDAAHNNPVETASDKPEVESAEQAPQTTPEPQPAADAASVLSAAPAAVNNGLRAEPTLRLVPVAGKREPHLPAAPAGGIPDSEPKLKPLAQAVRRDKPAADAGKIIPGEDVRKPVRVVMAPSEDKPEHPKSPNAAGLGSILLACFLILVLCAVAGIIFNQRIIQSLPQTQGFFTKLCGKIPCPGFYLADPKAFVVSKTSLRPLDESGNYALDVTIINGSNVAQAVPWLELELLDDNDSALMTKMLSPQDYLNDPASTPSIAPNRSMTVRVSLQTNVTSARCVVKPTYPDKN